MGIALQVIIIAALGGLFALGGIQGMGWLLVGIIVACAGASIVLWIAGRARAARLAQYLNAQTAAPAPEVTSFTFAISFCTTFSALSKAAATVIAVPCWSS